MTDLWPVQQAAVDQGLLEGKSLLILAPTSSGKTFVGEIAAVHQALSGRKTAILVPFKALAEERYDGLVRRWQSLELHVEISTGDRPVLERRALAEGNADVVLFTYERFLSLMGRRTDGINQFSTVVIDELQMVSDANRGGKLEWILTFLKTLESPPQLIGLSAVVDDLGGLDEWLEARVVRSNTRPLPLIELVVAPDGSCVGVKRDGENQQDVEARIPPVRGDVVQLVTELLRNDPEASIMVFHSVVDRTEQTALELRKTADWLGPSTASIQRLRELEQTELNVILQWCLERSIAVHNSELTAEEKMIIEEGLRQGEIRVVVTTTTLAMGVNLPCTVTVIAEHERPWLTPDKRMYSVGEYKNMAGRAGRYGVTSATNGTSYLLARDGKERDLLLAQYIRGSAAPVRSTLTGERLDALVLHILAQAADPIRSSELTDVLLGTFAGHVAWRTSMQQDSLRESVDELLSALANRGLVEAADSRYSLSEAGRICAFSGIDVESFCSVLGWINGNEECTPARFLAALCYVDAVANPAKLRFPNNAHAIEGSHSSVRRVVEEHIHPDSPEVSRVLSDLARWKQAWRAAAPCRMLATALMHMSGSGIGEIEQATRVRPGTLRDLVDRLEWLTDASIAAAEAFGKTALLKGLAEVQVALKYGVPPRGQDLARLGCLRRAEIIGLLGEGIDSPLRVLQLDDKTLSSILYGGQQERALGLKTSIMRSLGPLLPIYEDFVGRASPALVGIVHRLYGSRGTELERPVQDLFAGFLPALRVKQIRPQQSGEADYVFTARDGRVGIIGLGSRQDPHKPIGMTKAGQIITQSPELHPEIFVSLGFPMFDDVARLKAKAHAENRNYKMLTVSTLLESVLRTQEGSMDTDAIYKMLEDGLGDLG